MIDTPKANALLQGVQSIPKLCISHCFPMGSLNLNDQAISILIWCTSICSNFLYSRDRLARYHRARLATPYKATSDSTVY